ncbi:aminomethyl transferase family protein [Microbacterium sp. LMI12-1-1.1]|uniref:hypothetical protein n=1 Tax=Microbacterium sp. LMI12-1-1.1 TaxID=3135225 RepID=UPI00343F99AB
MDERSRASRAVIPHARTAAARHRGHPVPEGTRRQPARAVFCLAGPSSSWSPHPAGKIKFFHIGELQIAGKTVRALRHGMAGTPGFELYGPWDDQQVVREAIEETGQKYGLRKVGALAYGTSSQESSWMPIPLPAIYTATELQEFREWIGPFPLPALDSLGGSMTSTRIEDYYIDPIEAGYGPLVDWSREFVGSAALKEKAENPRRREVTLVWNDDDVADTIAASLFGEKRAQTLSVPVPHYAWYPADTVQNADGRQVGVSQWSSYSDNAGHVISVGGARTLNVFGALHSSGHCNEG